ncbi:hypothetical protein [Hyphobacterium sp.]|uniref:hypothetical protein n=1 Tax=Hyphobacterium sp. TaxID=2004662 RepID=UPI003BADB362
MKNSPWWIKKWIGGRQSSDPLNDTPADAFVHQKCGGVQTKANICGLKRTHCISLTFAPSQLSSIQSSVCSQCSVFYVPAAPHSFRPAQLTASLVIRMLHCQDAFMREIKRPVFLIIAALIAFGLLGAAAILSL